MDLLQFYSRWMISHIISVSFLVYTLLCVGSWSTNSWGCGPKTWGMLGGCKISLSAMQTPIRQKRPTLRIPYFRPSKCRLLYSAARCACPPSPLLPAATAWQNTVKCCCSYFTWIAIIQYIRIDYTKLYAKYMLGLCDLDMVTIEL